MLSKEEIEAALKKARDVEKEELLSDKDVVKTYNQGISSLEKARSLMKPSWFIKDTCKKHASGPVRRKK